VSTVGSISLDSLGSDATAAVRAMSEAMIVARSLEGRAASSVKPDTSPVTVADLAIQALIARWLCRDFPSDALIAEEDASLLRAEPEGALSRQVVEIVRRVIRDANNEQLLSWLERGSVGTGCRTWTLDPIDGTKGFLAGRQYVIALALIVDGVVHLAVIGCPRLSLVPTEGNVRIDEKSSNGGMAIALRGRGAWWSAVGERTWRRLEVSACRDASTARVVQSFERRHGDPERCARVLQLLGNDRPALLMDSQAKHVTVAAGVSDLLMRFPPDASFHDSVWDQAAGSLLIDEAGGRVTDLGGQPLDFGRGRRLLRNVGMLASNGVLHAAALAAVQGTD
jgi:HAL2 family 3'(2'),5'-bisphosphate nucleotidase